MNLKQRMSERKPSILSSWRDAALAIPASARHPGFSEKQRELIEDVSGFGLELGMERLFDALLQTVIPDNASRFLDDLVRIRAAHDVSASEALAFLPALKKIVHTEFEKDALEGPGLREELIAWDSTVDELMLFAFDIYVKTRESVLDARAREESQKTLRLLKKAKLISDDPG